MANPSTHAKDFGSTTTDKDKNKNKDTGGQNLADKAGDLANKGREMASNLADKGREVASNLADKAKDAASTAGEYAGNAAEKMTHAAGAGVRNLGETIREKGPRDGTLGTASRAVGDALQQGGRYLEEEGFSGMMEDVSELVRRYPIPAVLVGVGIGILIGRTLGS